MELSTQPQDHEPIIFDLSQLTDNQSAQRLTMHFRFGELSFNDELMDCVAASNGITEAGYLDQGMLRSVRQTDEYLEGRQGQPLVKVDTYRPTGRGGRSFTVFKGYVGTLGSDESLVGMKDNRDGSMKYPGIAVEDGFYGFRIIIEDDSGSLSTDSLYGDNGSVMPINVDPGSSENRDGEQLQEIVAGEDIVPWIIETFGSDIKGYEVYMDVVYALTRGEGYNFEALNWLLDNPFVDMARDEHFMHEHIEQTLTAYEKKDEHIRKIANGNRGEANLLLMDVATTFPQFSKRLPRTKQSNPMVVTEIVDGPLGDQVGARLKAIERVKDPLTKLMGQVIRNQ